MAEKAANKTYLTNVVRDNMIFREKVSSEKRHAYLREAFDFNPKYLVSVTDKPTRGSTL